MINHGFRRLALAHSLLPTAPDSPPDKADHPHDPSHAEPSPKPATATLDDDPSAQDHPPIHM
jgi:hypothetical protein